MSGQGMGGQSMGQPYGNKMGMMNSRGGYMDNRGMYDTMGGSQGGLDRGGPGGQMMRSGPLNWGGGYNPSNPFGSDPMQQAKTGGQMVQPPPPGPTGPNGAPIFSGPVFTPPTLNSYGYGTGRNWPDPSKAVYNTPQTTPYGPQPDGSYLPPPFVVNPPPPPQQGPLTGGGSPVPQKPTPGVTPDYSTMGGAGAGGGALLPNQMSGQNMEQAPQSAGATGPTLPGYDMLNSNDPNQTRQAMDQAFNFFRSQGGTPQNWMAQQRQWLDRAPYPSNQNAPYGLNQGNPYGLR